MNRYKIIFSEQSEIDMKKLEDVISFDYKVPLTAFRYLQGLKNEINQLSKTAESFPIQTGLYFRQYGNNVRRINYKRMTVIYNVYSNTVYIRRILPSNTITEL